ncbi:expressed unknown protein (Partial), partial [Seminavis robusta]|eukprot:Sro3672_g350140.1 n/a (252) ;mRNA; r:2-758
MTMSSRQMRFHFDWVDHWVEEESAEKSAKDIMHRSAGRMMSIQNFFNDLSLYRWLKKSTKGKVELARVVVFHSDSFVFGLQAVYRVYYSSSSEIREVAAEKHVYASGFYAQGRPPMVSTLELAAGEFIIDVTTRQGEVVDQITFITNQRTVRFGGWGGMAQPYQSNHFARGVMSRVVAFAGTKAGALERVGFFLEPLNWEAVRPIVLTRRLLEEKRALPDRVNCEKWTPQETSVHDFLTRANDDIFFRVASY